MNDFMTLIVVMVPQMYIYLQTSQVVYIICVHFLYVKHTSIKCLFKKQRNNESKIKKDREIPSFMEDEILLHPTPSPASKRPRYEAWQVRCPTPHTALQGQFTASQVQQGPGVGSWSRDSRESIGSGPLLCGKGWDRHIMIQRRKVNKYR